jgi:hypothetical protein
VINSQNEVDDGGGVKSWFPLARDMYLKIAEPRFIRILQFAVYICMLVAGIGIMAQPPHAFKSILGLTLVYIMASFLTFGALAGAVAVLPGVWWLERAGLLALATAMLCYMILILALGTSPMGIAIAIAFASTFVQRYLEIRGPQLAPKIVVNTDRHKES